MMGTIVFGANIIYVLFSSSEIQSWNDLNEVAEDEGRYVKYIPILSSWSCVVWKLQERNHLVCYRARIGELELSECLNFASSAYRCIKAWKKISLPMRTISNGHIFDTYNHCPIDSNISILICSTFPFEVNSLCVLFVAFPPLISLHLLFELDKFRTSCYLKTIVQIMTHFIWTPFLDLSKWNFYILFEENQFFNDDIENHENRVAYSLTTFVKFKPHNFSNLGFLHKPQILKLS